MLDTHQYIPFSQKRFKIQNKKSFMLFMCIVIKTKYFYSRNL